MTHFRGFVQQVRHYLRLYSSRYPDGFTHVAFIGTLLSGNARSWFAPLLEKDSPILYNLEAFMGRFAAAFGDSDQEGVAERERYNNYDKDHVLLQSMLRNFNSLHVILIGTIRRS